MRKRYFSKFKIIHLGLLLFVAFLFVPTFAAENSPENNIVSVDDVVSLNPAKMDLSGDPGETLKQSLRIANNSDEAILVALSVENVHVVNEEGKVAIIDHATRFPDYLMSWTEFSDKDFELAPNKNKIVDFQIKIPEDAEPGGRYGSIVISYDQVYREQFEPASVAKVGSIILLNVAGKGLEDMSLESFSYDKESESFTLRIKNSGSTHEKIDGKIIVRNVFGKTVAEIPLPRENVLPNNIRKIDALFEEKSNVLNYYSAELAVSYGEKVDKHLGETIRFIHIKPILSLAVLVLLSLFGLLAYRRFRA